MKLNLIILRDVFYHKSANLAFRGTLNVNCFSFLCKMICFDDKDTRDEYWKADKFAAIREIFELFNTNCAKTHIPSEYLTIDETLYPYHGRIKLKQYKF